MSQVLTFLLLCTPHIYAAAGTWEGDILSKYSVVNKGRMYGHTVLMHLKRINIEECLYYCIRHRRCVTISYSESNEECELNDMEFDDTEADTEAEGWTNYGALPKVNGQYSDWIAQTTCSATCGDGVITYRRFCNNPPPQYGGKTCFGEEGKTEKCNLGPCPPANWGQWQSISLCSPDCMKDLIRSCDSPAPSPGQAECRRGNGTYGLTESGTSYCYEGANCEGNCVYEYDTDYLTWGGVFFSAVGIKECAQGCFKMNTCKFWAWLNGRCYPKGKNDRKDKVDTIVGSQICAINPPCTIEIGRHYNDHDIHQVTTNSIKECSNECKKNSLCKYWELNKQHQLCYLKSEKSSNPKTIKTYTFGTRACADSL